MAEALIIFQAAGHIKFGLGGPPNGELTDGETPFLPVITVPLSAGIVYYRLFYVTNVDAVPYYNWKISVAAIPEEKISAQIGTGNVPKEGLLNSTTSPPVSAWKSTLTGKVDYRKALLEPNEPVPVWLRINASPQIEEDRTYTIIITFEGYA